MSINKNFEESIETAIMTSSKRNDVFDAFVEKKIELVGDETEREDNVAMSILMTTAIEAEVEEAKDKLDISDDDIQDIFVYWSDSSQGTYTAPLVGYLKIRNSDASIIHSSRVVEQYAGPGADSITVKCFLGLDPAVFTLKLDVATDTTVQPTPTS